MPTTPSAPPSSQALPGSTMPHRLGIVDLGSNTMRLVIYDYTPGHCYRLVDEVREVVRLRAGMGDTNVLRAQAMERSLNALRMFRSFSQTMAVEEVTVACTSAVRDAANRTSFLARAEQESGWQLRVLSGEEEGYYGALGAINTTGLEQGFVVDLGGGSVQVVEVREGLPRRSVSLPLGALRMTEAFLDADPVKPSQVTALRRFVQEQLAPLEWFQAQPGDQLVGIGGTIRNLAQMDQRSQAFPLDVVHGYRLPSKRLRSLSDQLWRLSLAKRRNLPGLRRDRADIVHAGALVYAVLLEESGFPGITISRGGLREGLFFERFLAHQEQPVFPDLRRFSVLNLARNFGSDTAHSHQVAFLALRMFDDLQPVHGLGPAYRELLWAAGLLHDLGTAIDYENHHLHSDYIVRNSALPGYTPRELALIALLCRYHRSKGTPKGGELRSLLTPEDRRGLSILAGIIRLAELLERGRHQVIRDLRCHFDVGSGWVQIEALAAGDAAMEIWDAGRNLGTLQEALDMHVELVQGVWQEEA